VAIARAGRQRRWAIVLLSGGCIAFMTGLWLAGSALSEQYFPLYPAVDTVFADGYDERRFDAIQLGMRGEEVHEALGGAFSFYRVSPLTHPGVPPGSTYVLGYSHDGGCAWGDFAWLGRYVYFDAANRVTGTAKAIHHD
jgi:hypothetical protein